jgi:ADP-ribosylarginine hydrolase
MSIKEMPNPSPRSRYEACMVLGAVGDCLGYNGGKWEFNRSGAIIHEEFESMGGMDKFDPKNWLVSDDTIMALATAKGLVVSFQKEQAMIVAKRDKEIKEEKEAKEKGTPKEKAKDGKDTMKSSKEPKESKASLFFRRKRNNGSNGDLDPEKKRLNLEYLAIAQEYVECLGDMLHRAPGRTCVNGVKSLHPTKENGYIIPFNSYGGGCGAAMRSMAVGLRYFREEEEHTLIVVSVESGRMTHNCPLGFLGSVASALFTAYAIRDIPAVGWGHRLLTVLPKVLDYIREVGRDVEENERHWPKFGECWKKYVEERKILTDDSIPEFPSEYGVDERDKYYTSLSLNGWGGSMGHDAPMIAYDALLNAGKNWKDLMKKAALHGGDNDSTGIIAGSWYGALYGFDGVPELNYKNVEKYDELKMVGQQIYSIATSNIL